ncbi:MAG: type VI secretion system baseplate subunit TssE [Burkholderiales bacterium]|nr:type VI secretion system baseplate subunit TssE [Nitrosomonas sp.]MCP5273342.1 type VI secretion system baseplate subunit TssE [Burkholderiales bacterium]
MGALTRSRSFPSLLDRLTNDDPVLLSLNNLKGEIEATESSLVKLSGALKDNPENPSVQIEDERRNLQLKLNVLRAKYTTLADSVDSKQDIRDCVKRDLEWLLNANRFFLDDEQEQYPEAVCSVLNYGTPDLTGKTVSGLNLVQLERQLYQTIVNFEPRIIQKTLSVSVVADPVKTKHNIFVFEIEGELCAKPSPVHLHLRTEFELENCQVAVYDMN